MYAQSEAAAQLNAEQTKLAELKKAKAELASTLISSAEENDNLKLSLQQEREAAAESEVQPSNHHASSPIERTPLKIDRIFPT